VSEVEAILLRVGKKIIKQEKIIKQMQQVFPDKEVKRNKGDNSL